MAFNTGDELMAEGRGAWFDCVDRDERTKFLCHFPFVDVVQFYVRSDYIPYGKQPHSFLCGQCPLFYSYDYPRIRPWWFCVSAMLVWALVNSNKAICV